MLLVGATKILKCFPFQEEMSRGDAICYLSCKDLPGGRTVPHATKRCGVGMVRVRLDEELGHFVTGYVETGEILVNLRLRIGTSLGKAAASLLGALPGPSPVKISATTAEKTHWGYLRGFFWVAVRLDCSILMYIFTAEWW